MRHWVKLLRALLLRIDTLKRRCRNVNSLWYPHSYYILDPCLFSVLNVYAQPAAKGWAVILFDGLFGIALGTFLLTLVTENATRVTGITNEYLVDQPVFTAELACSPNKDWRSLPLLTTIKEVVRWFEVFLRTTKYEGYCLSGEPEFVIAKFSHRCLQCVF